MSLGKFSVSLCRRETNYCWIARGRKKCAITGLAHMKIILLKIFFEIWRLLVGCLSAAQRLSVKFLCSKIAQAAAKFHENFTASYWKEEMSPKVAPRGDICEI